MRSSLNKYLSIIILSLMLLRTYRKRTYLVMLGIIIGIATIIIAFSVGIGGKKAILYEIDHFGADKIRLGYDIGYNEPKYLLKQYSLTNLDLLFIKNHCPSVTIASPVIGFSGISRYKNKNRVSKIFATDELYDDFAGGELLYGRFFNANEVKTRKKVAVLGQTFYEKVFGRGNPIGKRIIINNKVYIIIGVTKKAGIFSEVLAGDFYDK